LCPEWCRIVQTDRQSPIKHSNHHPHHPIHVQGKTHHSSRHRTAGWPVAMQPNALVHPHTHPSIHPRTAHTTNKTSAISSLIPSPTRTQCGCCHLRRWLGGWVRHSGLSGLVCSQWAMLGSFSTRAPCARRLSKGPNASGRRHVIVDIMSYTARSA